MHQALSPHETAGIRPPRATRRPIVSPFNIALSVVLVVAFQACLVFFLPRLLDGYAATFEFLGLGEVQRETFLRGEVPVVTFSAATPGAGVLVAIMGGALLVALAAAYGPRAGPLLRGVVIAEAALLGAAAAFMLATARAPFTPEEFSSLSTETSALTWLVLPLLLGVVSFSAPFRLRERAALLLAVLAYSVVLSAVRTGFLSSALEGGGSVLMAPLFLNFGPLLDIVGAIAIFSVVLARVSARLQSGEPRRVWSWS